MERVDVVENERGVLGELSASCLRARILGSDLLFKWRGVVAELILKSIVSEAYVVRSYPRCHVPDILGLTYPWANPIRISVFNVR